MGLLSNVFYVTWLYFVFYYFGIDDITLWVLTGGVVLASLVGYVMKLRGDLKKGE